MRAKEQLEKLVGHFKPFTFSDIIFKTCLEI